MIFIFCLFVCNLERDIWNIDEEKIVLDILRGHKKAFKEAIIKKRNGNTSELLSKW